MSHLGFTIGRGSTAALAVLVTLVMALTSTAAGAVATTSSGGPAPATSVSLPDQPDRLDRVAERAERLAARHAQRSGRFSVPVTGTTEAGRSVAATFTPRRFRERGGDLVVVGTLRGSIAGTARPFNRRVVMPVADVTSSGSTSPTTSAAAAVPACDVLNLVLGPLDLNLLGLEVDLEQVVLDIAAQPGAGNLLGNLLCAVAGLLDGVSLGGAVAGLLDVLADLLNRILGQLNG